MTKRLTVTYGSLTLYDEEPHEVTFSETEGVFKVQAGDKKPNALEGLAKALQDKQKAQKEDTRERVTRPKSGSKPRPVKAVKATVEVKPADPPDENDGPKVTPPLPPPDPTASDAVDNPPDDDDE